MTTPIDQLTEALSGTAQLVAGIRPDQWADRTPCAEWDVRQLVNHLVAGNRLFTRLLQGEQMPAPADLISQGSRDQLGDDPEAAYRKSADGLVAAFAQPGALEQMVTAPIGTVPGIAALHLRMTEALVHGWDLAQATDRPRRPWMPSLSRNSPSHSAASPTSCPAVRRSRRPGRWPTTRRRSTGSPRSLAASCPDPSGQSASRQSIQRRSVDRS